MYSQLPSISWGRSSIRNLRTHTVVVAGTHLSRLFSYTALIVFVQPRWSVLTESLYAIQTDFHTESTSASHTVPTATVPHLFVQPRRCDTQHSLLAIRNGRYTSKQRDDAIMHFDYSNYNFCSWEFLRPSSHFTFCPHCVLFMLFHATSNTQVICCSVENFNAIIRKQLVVSCTSALSAWLCRHCLLCSAVTVWINDVINQHVICCVQADRTENVPVHTDVSTEPLT